MKAPNTPPAAVTTVRRVVAQLVAEYREAVQEFEAALLKESPPGTPFSVLLADQEHRQALSLRKDTAACVLARAVADYSDVVLASLDGGR